MKQLLKVLLLAVFCLSATAGWAQYSYSSTSSYRPHNTGSRLDRSKFYHGERRPKVKSVTKEDCRYQTKVCLDEFCLDEVDGYKKCKNNSITDFYGLVETCMDALPTGNERASYRRSCQPYMDSVINDYLKQMKSFMRYQTDMNKCDRSRDKLDAAQSCYGIAIARGGAKSKTLKSLLTKACGDEVTGGSELMVEEFWGAGYMGADGAGWIANFAMLNFGSKQHGWQKVVDATLARYIDHKRVSCGEGEYTVGEVGKYSAKMTHAGDALRLGVASAILKKNMQTQAAASAVGNVIFLDTQTPRNEGSYTPVNPAASEADAQMHLAKATKALALGKSFPVSIEDLYEIYYTTPVAGDVLIWFQHNQPKKCYMFVVKDPAEGNLEPVSRRQLQSMKMLNKELAPYYDKCFKNDLE